MMNRRRFLAAAPLLVATTHASLRAAGAPNSGRPPRILLRSSWQSVNIGDIGHTPGALGLLERFFPEAEITLWPGELGHGARELLVRAFPRLRIVEGSLDAEGRPRSAALTEAWHEADLYLSGSGSGFPAAAHAVAFRRATGKPVGVFGVSNDPISGFGAGRDPEGGTLRSLRERALALPVSHLAKDLRYVIDASAFFFCRDTITRDYLKAQGVKTPVLEFGPDAQLGMTLRDDARGMAWLDAHGLQPGSFICVIPRLRYTPYHRIRSNAKASPDDAAKDAINARTVDTDHAKLRDLIVAYVRATGNQVVACAEMTYQVALAREQLVDPLPADVKSRVVWRDTYWLPDEAASIYARAQAVISMECHSPLIALRNGTPAFYLRQPTDTCKGQMYRDFGAGEWMFEIDESDGKDWWKTLSVICADTKAATARVAAIMRDVETRQRRMVDAVRTAVAAGS
jgi:hypothetical protein